MNKRKMWIVCLGVASCLLIGGMTTYFVYQNHLEVQAKEKLNNEQAAKKVIASLYSDKGQKTPKLEITSKALKGAQAKVNKLDKSVKRSYEKKLNLIKQFVKARDEIRAQIDNGILKSATTDEQVTAIQTLFQKLDEPAQAVLKAEYDIVIVQRQAIKDLDVLVQSFYTDGAVNAEINPEAFQKLKDTLTNLPQRDIADSYNTKLAEVQARVDEIAEQERIRLEAERQAAIARAIAESERLRKENEAIQAANVIIPNVPLIDQSINVHNGCEVASLLMALQHFGINNGMSLIDIANAVPKSDNPHTGFVLDIFTLYPREIAHWIAPDALTTFGQTYHSGVANITGASPDQLKAEINAGNPVIIYATYGFAYPKAWCWDNQIPVNMHVMLLVGYNQITGNYIINEPWGGKQIIVAKDNFEREYGRTKGAVVIRP